MEITMRQPSLTCLPFVAILLVSGLPAMAQLPKRDLVIEFRQIDQGDGLARESGYSVSTQGQQPDFLPQQVHVRNGEKASLRIAKSMPLQWVQSVATQSAALAASGSSITSRTGALAQSLTWMEAGQSLMVQPSWPGAKQDVKLEIDLQSSRVGERTGPELPDQSRRQLVTTVSAPLGQWVTVAGTGASPPRGVYSSEAVADTRHWLQIRVLAP
jgi:hypothetical protein